MEVGLVGKPNVGKTTFFSAATLIPAEIANYPFTTIEANRGVTYVRTECAHTTLGVQCEPRNSKCEDGIRLVPVEMIDVAGLVPDAHAGKGLGNQFLNDLSRASALIHIIDASGGTDLEGTPCPRGAHDPLEDVRFLETEITEWIVGIIKKGWRRVAKGAEMRGERPERIIAERLTGLRVNEHHIVNALRAIDHPPRLTQWSDEHMHALGEAVRRLAKPMIIAANKWDIAPDEIKERLLGLEGRIVIPTCAEVELALRKADHADFIDYMLGAETFTVTAEDKLSKAQRNGLDKIQHLLASLESTGVQNSIEAVIFDLLDRIAVYPVESETHYTDHDGNVLPDVYLLKRGANARDLAYKIHTDLGEGFIRAIDARSKRVVGADHALKNGDVIKIVSHQ